MSCWFSIRMFTGAESWSWLDSRSGRFTWLARRSRGASSRLKTVNTRHNFTRVDFIQKRYFAFSNRISKTIQYQFCRRRNCGQFTNTTCVKKISPGSELKPHFVPQTGNISDPSQDRNRKQQPESNREITFSVQLALYISKKFCENRIVQCPHGIRCAIFTFHWWGLKKV